jgi:hypothetical protein
MFIIVLFLRLVRCVNERLSREAPGGTTPKFFSPLNGANALVTSPHSKGKKKKVEKEFPTDDCAI